MMNFMQKQCTPCKGGVEPLKGDALKDRIDKLDHGWEVVEEHHLQKEFKFPDFKEALSFVNKIGQLAEQEGHHPDIYLGYGKVKVLLWTHKIDGIHENDFIVAAKIEEL